MSRGGRRAVGVLLLAGAIGVLAACGAGPTGPGTRAEPTPVGVTTDIGAWTLAFGPTLTDADALIAADDPANRPPPDGRHYVVAPIRLTFNGDGAGEPWLDLEVRYVTSAGGLYGRDEIDQCGSVPGSLEYVDKMPPGATRWGTVCVAVPADEVGGGAWVARNGGFWDWNGYFEAAGAEPSGPGTRGEPTPAGMPVEVGDYTVAIGATRPDALGAIRRWDENAAPPAPGRRYVMAPVTVTFHGGGSSGEPWSDLRVAYVGPDGRAFGAADEDSCGDIPDPLDEAGVVPPEAPRTANACVSVPADAVSGGRWHVLPEGTAFVWEGFVAGA